MSCFDDLSLKLTDTTVVKKEEGESSGRDKEILQFGSTSEKNVLGAYLSQLIAAGVGREQLTRVPRPYFSPSLYSTLITSRPPRYYTESTNFCSAPK